jgi:bis(5'-adenosyl)-triphosphatase
VPHVHVHILPRKAGDFPNNDEIYDKIEQSGELPGERGGAAAAGGAGGGDDRSGGAAVGLCTLESS